MADILRIGLSALLAQQRALAATSNNIANASTPGYSRQRVELADRPVEGFGNGQTGTGVQVTTTRRLTDDIVADQVRTAAGAFNRADSFVGLAQSLDDLLANDQTGLSATLQSLSNALHDVANDPSSVAARQSLLSEAGNTVSRFQTLDARLTQVGDEVRARLGSTVDQITSLGKGIADINRQILATSSPTSGPPADLLDQRDQLLQQLAGLVQVDTAPQSDGTMSVFIGSGQVLVLGTQSSQLAVTAGTFDPDQPQIVLKGTGPDVDVTQQLSGGQLGGTLDFEREMLVPARAAIGRIAAGLVETFNAQHRNGMDLQGLLGGDFFGIGAPQTFSAATNTGSAAVTTSIASVAALQSTDYRLSYDGTSYSLQRTDNGAIVPLSGAGTVANPLVADGLSFVVSGAAAAGDQFLVKPLEHLPGTLQLLVTDPANIAAAAPTRTAASLGNVGTASISAGQVVDVTDPNLLAAATIQFIDPTHYSVNGAGNLAYTPGADIDVNGTRVQISGAPATGDQFTISSNAGGGGDNRNALATVAALGASVFNGNVTLAGAANSLVSSVGAQTTQTSNQRDAQNIVLQQGQQRLDSVRGVNLDEEASNMLQQQQLYQAAAQTMAVAQTLFQTLIAALRG